MLESEGMRTTLVPLPGRLEERAGAFRLESDAVIGFEGPNGAYVELPLNVRTENPKTSDGVYMGQKFQRTEFPQYALTFTLR